MKHRIGLTVTDPNHPMVSKRKETIQKTVRVTGDDKEKAIDSAIAHYKRKGYKVHDHHYIGTVQEGYGSNRGYAHGFASPHAPSLGGPRHREDDEGWDREPKQADVPHAVHINGKKWKSFSSQSHAQNVANKIKGATVHKEEVDLEEGTFKYHMDKAIAADQKGDAKKKAYHLDNARSAKLAMPSKDYAKNRELLNKHKEMSEGYNDIGPQYGGAYVNGRSDDAMMTAKLTRHAKAAAKKAGKTFNTSAEYRMWHAKQKPKKTVKEEVVLESHEKAAKEIHGALFHNAIPPGSESHFVNSVLKSHGLTPADKGKVVDQVHKMGYTGNKLKEAVHRIGLTVTDPNHPMVSKRKETIQKTVRVKGEDREKAITGAIAHYKRKGYKVHDHHYIGVVNEAKSTSGVYEKSEENKRSADAAKKQGDMFAHHMHMADYHDNLAQWHAEEGRHNISDSHAEKSEKHHDQAMKLKEETNMDTRIWEAWGMSKRDPQKGIKVGQQVRSYDFPGMHDDHYIEGHVVGETPHSYHIRTSKVVRGGKEVPVPAHMSHVEAPKGRGMFNNAYAVHKIIAKQDSVAAKPQPAQGAAKTFAAVRGKK